VTELGEPKLSVVVLTYNHAQWIEQTLRSVLEQETTFAYEVVVTEDCSTDGTREIVLDWERRDERVKTLLSPVNMNDLEVLLRGFRAARGDYIALVEGDDYWTSPRKLELQIDFLERHPECSSCFHNARILTADGTFSEMPYYRTPEKTRLTTEDILMANNIPTCSVVFRKSVADALPAWYRELPVGDSTLHLTAAMLGEVAYIDETLAVYRRHGGGAWSGRDVVQQAHLSLEWRALVDEKTEGRFTRVVRRGQAREYRRLARIYSERGQAALARANYRRFVASRLLGLRAVNAAEVRLGLQVFAPRVVRASDAARGHLRRTARTLLRRRTS
jgi:glycosyltransferase involved in cell wall biosynthesis